MNTTIRRPRLSGADAGVAVALIGLVGGLGPAATVYYYQALLAECARRSLQPRVVIGHADVQRVLDAASRDARDELADYLASILRELEGAGSSLLAIGAVTPHLCMPELAQRIRTPIVDIIDVLNTELRRRRLERVVLIGTRMTVESRLFGRLAATAVDLSPSRIAQAHDLYVDIVRAGRVSDETARALRALGAEISARGDVQAIVLAGTELALVPAGVWGDANVIDCARLHIEAIVRAARLETTFARELQLPD
jgi:aspartate racemase